jgi:hypothetical protein
MAGLLEPRGLLGSGSDPVYSQIFSQPNQQQPSNWGWQSFRPSMNIEDRRGQPSPTFDPLMQWLSLSSPVSPYPAPTTPLGAQAGANDLEAMLSNMAPRGPSFAVGPRQFLPPVGK